MIEDDFEIIDVKDYEKGDDKTESNEITITAPKGKDYKVYKNSKGYLTSPEGRLYKLKSEIANVPWFDRFDKELILYILRNNGSILTIEEALKKGLDIDPRAMWGDNLHKYNTEPQRPFLRVGFEF